MPVSVPWKRENEERRKKRQNVRLPKQPRNSWRRNKEYRMKRQNGYGLLFYFKPPMPNVLNDFSWYWGIVSVFNVRFSVSKQNFNFTSSILRSFNTLEFCFPSMYSFHVRHYFTDKIG